MDSSNGSQATAVYEAMDALPEVYLYVENMTIVTTRVSPTLDPSQLSDVSVTTVSSPLLLSLISSSVVECQGFYLAPASV